MRKTNTIWILTSLMLSVFAVIEVASGGMTIFVRSKDGDQVSLDLSSDATVGDVFAAASSFGVQGGSLKFGDVEHQDPSVSLADIGVCSETTVEIHPIPIRWTMENLDSRKPIFRAEIRRPGRHEGILIYLQWLPYRKRVAGPRTNREKMSICWFMLVMASESDCSTFYRYQRLDTNKQRADFPHYARLQDIFDQQQIHNDPSHTLPRVFANIGDHPLNFDNSNVFSFNHDFTLHYGRGTAFRVVIKDVVFHDGEIVDNRPISYLIPMTRYQVYVFLVVILFFMIRYCVWR